MVLGHSVLSTPSPLSFMEGNLWHMHGLSQILHITGCQLKIILYALKLDQRTSFESKNSFELLTQKQDKLGLF